MPVDESLSYRFRSHVEGLDGLSEKKMMGADCFLFQGNMIGGAWREKSGAGKFLFRVGKGNIDRALAVTGCYQLVQGGRKMGGFIILDEDEASDDRFSALISIALGHVFSLPAK
jgi:TfoX/Sxy family transcriptional regulator of competence genes